MLKSTSSNKIVSALIFIIPLVVYAAMSVHYLLGQEDLLKEPRFAQMGMQVQDLEWIKADFWQALLYNHYQPPLMSNIINGLLYIFVPSLLFPLYIGMNVLMSWLAFAAFIWFMHKMDIHPNWILIVGLFTALYPLRLEQEASMGYAALSYALAFLCVAFFYQFIRHQRLIYFVLLSSAVLLLTLLNSYFHCFWGASVLGLACLLSGQCKKWLIPLAIVALLIFAWPAKNWVIFGSFSASSSQGLVLAQRVDPNASILLKHIRNGEVPKMAWILMHPYGPDIYTDPQMPFPEKYKGIKVLTEPWKGFYTPEEYGNYATFNYNYYKVIQMCKLLTKYSIWYAIHHPDAYAKVTIAQICHFFSGDNSVLDPCFPHITKYHFSEPYGIAVRGLLYMFSILGGFLYLILRWQHRKTLQYRIMLFIMFNIAHSLFMGIVIAYCDGTRYRFNFELYYAFLLAFCLSRLIPFKAKSN